MNPEALKQDAWLTCWYAHPIVRRMFWFLIGGILSVGGNYGLLRFFMHWFGLSRPVGYAFSLAAMTGFTFAWSYFVNFRTSEAWHLCARKYTITLALCYGINYLLAQFGFRTFPMQTAIVITAVQVAVAFFKFGIFHFWVFPNRAAVLEPVRG